MYGQFWSYICNDIFIYEAFAGKTLIFRKPIPQEVIFFKFGLFSKFNEIRRDSGTSLLSTSPPPFWMGFAKYQSSRFQNLPPKSVDKQNDRAKNVDISRN